MKQKTIYLLLCSVGVALPYWQLIPWMAANGLHLSLFLQQLFTNRIGAFFGMDVLVSVVALMFFARAESTHLGARARWIAVLTVGVSLGLPLLPLHARATIGTYAANSRSVVFLLVPPSKPILAAATFSTKPLRISWNVSLIRSTASTSLSAKPLC